MRRDATQESVSRVHVLIECTLSRSLDAPNRALGACKSFRNLVKLYRRKAGGLEGVQEIMERILLPDTAEAEAPVPAEHPERLRAGVRVKPVQGSRRYRGEPSVSLSPSKQILRELYGRLRFVCDEASEVLNRVKNLVRSKRDLQVFTSADEIRGVDQHRHASMPKPARG